MSKHAPRVFLIRGFDPETEGFFKSFGSIDQRSTFQQKAQLKQFQAVTDLLVGPFSSLTLGSEANTSGHRRLDVIDLTIYTTAVSGSEIDSDTRAEIETIFTRWAEKLRIPGNRGFRSSAIKTPIYQRNDADNVEIRTQVILGTTVHYSDRQRRYGLPAQSDQAEYDISNLAEHLENAIPTFVAVVAQHSTFGQIRIDKGQPKPALTTLTTTADSDGSTGTTGLACDTGGFPTPTGTVVPATSDETEDD